MSKADKWLENIEKEIENAKKDGEISPRIIELVSELRIHQSELEMQNEELKQSQDELSQLYSQYHELYDEAPLGYFTLDKDGIITSVNNKGTELLQLKKNQIIGRGFSRFIPKESENKYYHSLANVVDTGEVQKVELQLKRNETLFNAKMEILPLFSKDEGKYRIIVTEIIERKKAEKELLDSEQMLRLATQTAGMYTWELDIATGEISFSGDVKSIIGFSYTEDDDVFSRIGRYTVPEDGARHRKALQRTMRGKGDLHSVNRVVNPETGEIIWMETHATLVRATDGKPLRVVGIARNITESKKAEEALRKAENRQTFLLKLNDALRSISDAKSIQDTALHMLSRHLGASQANYAEYQENNVCTAGEFK